MLETRERQEQLQLARWSWTLHGGDRDGNSELEFGSVYDGGINTFVINREGRLSAIEVLDAMDWIYCRSITLLLASQD